MYNQRSGVDRREMSRRLSDEHAFHSCPKFEKHELTVGQIEDIANQAAQKAMHLMDEKKDIEFAQFVRKIGMC